MLFLMAEAITLFWLAEKKRKLFIIIPVAEIQRNSLHPFLNAQQKPYKNNNGWQYGNGMYIYTYIYISINQYDGYIMVYH